MAALFALACSFPAVMLLGVYGPPMFAVAGVIALVAFIACRGALRQFCGARRRPAFSFELAALPEVEELEMLELTERHSV